MTDTAMQRARRFLTFAKSVDDSALSDLEQVPDYTDDKTKVPSTAELGGGGAPFAARGGQAPTQVAAHSDLAPQMGIAEQYEHFKRMGELEKSVGTLTGVVKGLVAALKAEEPKKDEDEVEKAYALLRKARAAVRKAEDEDDEEDAKDDMEKAEAHLVAAKAALAKADEMADDEDKEKAAEKARTVFRTVKSTISAAKAARLAKSAAPIAVIEPAAPVVAEAAKAEPTAEISPDMVKAVEAMQTGMAMQTKTMGELMATLAGASRGAPMPPAFAKASAPDRLAAATAAVDKAADDELIEGLELMKARGILSRFRAVANGTLDAAVLDAEIEKAPPLVKGLFTPTQVAA